MTTARDIMDVGATNYHNLHAGGSSRHEIDMAIGVVMGLRRCSERQAFNEIAAAVGETGVSLGGICRALHMLASGRTDRFEHSTEVVGLWGELVGGASDVVGHGPP